MRGKLGPLVRGRKGEDVAIESLDTAGVQPDVERLPGAAHTRGPHRRQPLGRCSHQVHNGAGDRRRRPLGDEDSRLGAQGIAVAADVGCYRHRATRHRFEQDPRQPFGVLVRAADQYVGGLYPPVDAGLLGEHVDIRSDVVRARPSGDLVEDRWGSRGADHKQQRSASRRVCGGELGHRVHDVEHAFPLLDLTDAQQHEALDREVEGAAQGGAVFGRLELP